MSKDNLSLWNRVNKPPASALKQIKGGRLSGMTDINPQWRLEKITEEFGLCGIGWKYTIDRIDIIEALDQIEVVAYVSLYVRVPEDPQCDDGWSAPIPGIGGNMLVQKEREGLRVNDEAQKMAVTDALSVAFKALGFGAEIYAGRWDGSKYRDVPDEPSSGVQSRMKREPNENAPMQGKREPSTAPENGLEAADESAVTDYYVYITEHGVKADVAGNQIETARAKYGGSIPKAWLEHMLTQARLKFGDKLSGDSDE